MKAHLQPDGWETSPGAKRPKTAPRPGSRDRSSRPFEQGCGRGSEQGCQARAGSWAAKGLDLAIDASEPIICRWSVDIPEPHAQEEVASGIPEVHVLEPSACYGFYAVEARARRRVDNLRRHDNMTSEEKVDAVFRQNSCDYQPCEHR